MEKQNKILALILLVALVAAMILGISLDRSVSSENGGNYQILITEICAKNDTIIAGNDGVFWDYIELYNAGQDVNLAGFTLTDGQKQFTFGNVALASGEYRLVFLGAEVTGFSLGASGGDCVQLKDPAGSIVVQVKVAAMLADQVMILQSGVYHTSSDASPGFPNDIQGLASFRQGRRTKVPKIQISEILAENVTACPDELGKYSDVIELHNVSEQSISLGQFWLSDNPAQRFRFHLPDVNLPPDGYVLVFCDGRNYTDENGMIHANFGLSLGDVLCLTDSNGGYITADVVFGGEDRSVALTQEGIYEVSAPSLGWPNTEAGIYDFARSRVDEHAALVISEVLLSDSGIPRGGALKDVVEIVNRSGKAVSTAGWYLTDGSNAYESPLPEQILEPGEYLILECNPSNTGFSLRVGETVSLTTPEFRIASPVTCVPADPGMSISLLGEGYIFAEPSLGFSNDDLGRKNYARLIQPNGLRISELMTANLSHLLGPYGVGSDWVELYNASSEAVSLCEYHLSDDPLIPNLCAMPDITLDPGEYCVILLTSKTENLPKGYTSIPLSLSSEGDVLYLSLNGAITDYVVIPAMMPDISFGRPDGSATFSTLSSVTPGEANSQGAQIAPMPKSLTSQGVYDNISCLDVELTGDGEIYYTTDCTAPGSDAILYTDPIHITKTTVIRAVCRQPGKLQSQILDLTFLLNEQDNLPAISLVLEPNDLWSADYGIYVQGYHAETEFPYKGANYWQNWERRASVSLFEKDGTGFSSPCGIKIFGAFSRALPLKAFSCFFRDAYGASELHYPIYGEDGLDTYESFVLRASGQDVFTTRMRDVLITSLAGEATNIPVQKYRPVVLYLNGEFWGVYYIREKISENYVAGNYNVSSDTVILTEKDGLDCPEYMELYNYAITHNLADAAHYSHISEMMDIDEYIDYIVAQMCIGNPDNGNAKFFKYDGGKWTWILYDTDLAFHNVAYSSVTEHLSLAGTGVVDSTSTRLINALLQNSEFKDKFLSRMSWQLNNIWTSENILGRIEELDTLIAEDLKKDYARWNHNYQKRAEFVESLRMFARDRRDIMINYIKVYFCLTEEQLKSYGFIP